METILRFLMPFFISTAVDADAARADILETLASYGTRTRAELLNAAQIIAFGMSTLDALSEARTSEMSTSMRIRCHGCANSLNRSCKQNEKALDRQLSCDPPVPVEPAPEPIVVEPAPEPVNDIDDMTAEEVLRQARAAATPARPATGVQSLTERNKRAWGAAMLEVLEQMGMHPGNAAPPAA